MSKIDRIKKDKSIRDAYKNIRKKANKRAEDDRKEFSKETKWVPLKRKIPVSNNLPVSRNDISNG